MMSNLSRITALIVLVATSPAALAALPTGVEGAITGAGADAATALGAIMLVAVGIWALRRVLRLFGR